MKMNRSKFTGYAWCIALATHMYTYIFQDVNAHFIRRMMTPTRRSYLHNRHGPVNIGCFHRQDCHTDKPSLEF